eukprot:3874051-Prymnesium_polylepis.1
MCAPHTTDLTCAHPRHMTRAIMTHSTQGRTFTPSLDLCVLGCSCVMIARGMWRGCRVWAHGRWPMADGGARGRCRA